MVRQCHKNLIRELQGMGKETLDVPGRNNLDKAFLVYNNTQTKKPVADPIHSRSKSVAENKKNHSN